MPSCPWRRLGDAVTWLEGRCISFGKSIPLPCPSSTSLRENFSIQEFDGEPEIIAKIEHGMRRMGGGLRRIFPAMRYFLSVDPGDPAFRRYGGCGADGRKIFDAVRALPLRGGTLATPLVLVVEESTLDRPQQRRVSLIL